LEKPISNPLANLLERRQNFASTSAADEITITDSGNGKVTYMTPIVSEGSVIGAIMSLKSDEKPVPDETEKKLINTGALFLSKQLRFSVPLNKIYSNLPQNRRIHTFVKALIRRFRVRDLERKERFYFKVGS
jgi:hypothetical protein